MFTRKIIFRTILVLAFFSVRSADATWFKVNDGNALDWGAGSTVSTVSIGKNANGDLFCLFRSKDFDTPVMVRFSCGGDTPPKKWEFFTDGAWTNQSDDLPAAAFNTIAVFKGAMTCPANELKLFPLPGDDEGLLGMLVFIVRNSTIGLDVHGAPGNVVFDDPNDGNGPRWRQWKSGTDYEPYYMRALIPSWNGVGGYDFALDPDSGTGLLVGTVNDKLTAARYDHNHATQRWHRWDATSGSWTTDFTWPGDTEVDKYTILDPNAQDCERFSSPKVAHLGSGNYLVVFGYDPDVDASGAEITSAARYDGDTAAWSWWDGNDWAQGGDYDYGTVVDSQVGGSMQLVVADQNLVSMFYISSGMLCELTYDERGAEPNFGSSVEIAPVYAYRAAPEPNGTVWLYYANNGSYPYDPNVYLKKKPLGATWSDPETIHSYVSPLYAAVDEATFVADSNIPVCFIREGYGNYRLYAISSPDANTYWGGETPVTLSPPPAPGQADSRIVWINEVEGDDDCSNYAGMPTVHLTLDNDGYLYAPATGFDEVRVRHKDDTNPDNNRAWGEFWDLIAFPGGAAVDNVGEKVYVANRLILSNGIAGGGHIRAFDMSKRTKRLGWGSLPACYDEAYSPTQFGSANWPGDLAVDQTQGLLYVTSSSDCEIKVYDLSYNPPVYQDTFGSEGDANGQFKFPQGIDVDPNGNIYVADTGNHRIQKFDPNGDFLTNWGSFGNGNGQFYYPFSVTADPNYNLVYVTDPFNRRVQIFDRQGNFLYTWGKWNPDQGAAEEFIQTGGVAADGKGNLYVNTRKSIEEYIVKFSIYLPDVDNNSNGIPDSLEGSVYNATQEKFYSSINSGIDDANSGDELAVYPGTYLENVDFDGKAITVRSLDPNDVNLVAATVIDANGASWAVELDANATLKGFTVTGAVNGGGILCCNSASPFISNCIIEDNSYEGIKVANAGSPTITNNKIGENSRSGIWAFASSGTTTIRNNWIYGNGYVGILSSISGVSVTNNTIAGNTSCGIARNPSGPTATVTNCIVWDNGDDLSNCSATYSCISDCNDAGGVGNICGDANDPNFVNPDANDFHLLGNSPCINAGYPNGDYSAQNDIDGDPRLMAARVDMGADEVVPVNWYVDGTNGSDDNDGLSWSTAFATIQKAIDTASNPDYIDVNEGTYDQIDFEGKRVTIQSIDYDDWTVVVNTIIDANGADHAVYFHNSKTSSSMLRGFTITGADHGIYCNDASPVIENCVIRENEHTGEDGAGMYNDNASPTVNACVFYYNEADYGGGMYNYYYSCPNVTNCLFYYNRADEYGGGMYNDYDSCPTIVNCTFFENNSDDRGGGIYNEDDSDAQLINCIFWGNDADDGEEIYNDDADPNFSDCCIRGGLNGDYCGGDDSTDGGGNISDDPDFEDETDPEGYDEVCATCDDGLRIKSTSPCKDVGDNAAVEGIDADIKGSDRKINNTVDMGAYEYDSGC
ncbi:MAG: right-handed parallel beta-helix repeat-containing protein [Planctomycetota bacterium]|jgi:parallel beta-helix repeat protein